MLKVTQLASGRAGVEPSPGVHSPARTPSAVLVPQRPGRAAGAALLGEDCRHSTGRATGQLLTVSGILEVGQQVVP